MESMISGLNVTIGLKLLIAAVLGIIIGFDRERSGKPAGIRTQMLVCVGSALLASVSVDLGQVVNYGDAVHSTFRLDPARLMAQIVSGIGFLGAGVILKTGNKVQGVTTAATIWITAAIGIAIGAGFYIPAGVATFLVLMLNPLAKMQYRYGLKGDFYVVSVPLKKQDALEKIFERHFVDIRQRSVTNGDLKVLIHSSNQMNKKLVGDLKDKRIPFEFTLSVE